MQTRSCFTGYTTLPALARRRPPTARAARTGEPPADAVSRDQTQPMPRNPFVSSRGLSSVAMPILNTVVRRSVTAVRPSVARTLNVSARVMKDGQDPNYTAGMPIPRAGERMRRDLVQEQVDRESDPTPVSIVSDAPSTYHQLTQTRSFSARCASTSRLSPPRCRAVPARSTGASISTCSRAPAAGRARSWAGQARA